MEAEAEVTNPRMFAALRILEKVAPPTVYGRPPYWRAPVAVDPGKVFVPSWNWSADYRELPEGEEPITIDANGAFLAAAGSVQVAHSELKHYGQLDAWDLNPRSVLPGYYLIEAFRWAFDASIVSPLGNMVKLPDHARVWVAAPTLVLLLELLAEGTIVELVITDSWAAERRCDFREWVKRLKVARNGLLDNIAKAETEDAIRAAKLRYKAFKEGYGSAFSMMLTGEKCGVRRPDWAHQVYAQHAATSWRKAWRFSAGAPLLAMGNTDTMTVLEADLKKAVLSTKPPIKLDPSGRLLGHYKKAEQEEEVSPVDDADALDFVMSDDFGDVL
jgi:hypothetical protein